MRLVLSSSGNKSQGCLSGLFCEYEDMSPERFNVSRVDLKSDIEDLPINVVLSRLYAMGYRRESVCIIRGSTISGYTCKRIISD